MNHAISYIFGVTSRRRKRGWCFAVVFLLAGKLLAGEVVLTSGDARLILAPDSAGGSYDLRFEHDGRLMQTYTPEKPLSLEINGNLISGAYSTVVTENGTAVCQGGITTKTGSRFLFTDHFRAGTHGTFELKRIVKIQYADPTDRYFNTIFGIEVASGTSLPDYSYFVPSLWYRTNFESEMHGALARYPDDRYFLFRGDRLPLPLAMMRKNIDGQTVSLLHLASTPPATIEEDRGAERLIDERMQFGSIGVRQLEGTSLAFMFPGSRGREKSRRST